MLRNDKSQLKRDVEQIKNAEQIEQFSKGAMLSVSDKSESVNKHTHTDQQNNKVPYSMSSPEEPMN